MSDPPRWLDDTRAPDGAASLLRAARPSKALDVAAQARSAAKLAELATASAAATTASTPSVLFTSMWPKVLVGLAAIALVGASAVGLRAPRATVPRPHVTLATPHVEETREARVSPIAPAPPRVEVTTPIAAPPRPSAPRVARAAREIATPSPPSEMPIEAPPPVIAPPREVAPTVAPGTSSPANVGVSSEAPAATLLEETESLARVSSAVEPDPAAARRLLDAYRARFTHSRLAPERDYLAFEIARRQGAVDEARALGEAFLRAHPRSPHASAVRARLTP